MIYQTSAFFLDIKFYFHISGGTKLAVSWISESSTYTKVEISHAPAGDAVSPVISLPPLAFDNGGGLIDLPDEPILHYLQITVKDSNSIEKKMPPVYVDFDNYRKFWNNCFSFLQGFLSLTSIDSMAVTLTLLIIYPYKSRGPRHVSFVGPTMYSIFTNINQQQSLSNCVFYPETTILLFFHWKEKLLKIKRKRKWSFMRLVF